MLSVEEIAKRHGLTGAISLLAAQGKATFAYGVGRHVIKVGRVVTHGGILTEVTAGPCAREAGVRTPALIAWSHGPEGEYSIWERVEGEPLDERDDPPAWRDLGRQLAALHTVERCDDPHGVLAVSTKRDPRPHLPALDPERADFFARWLERLEVVRAAPVRLVHNDVHGMNVLVRDGEATVIDWGDAAWADPATEFGAMPIQHVAHVLSGYEEVGSLGEGAEACVLRALIGQAVRLRVLRGLTYPLEGLAAFLRGEVPARFRPWLPPLPPPDGLGA